VSESSPVEYGNPEHAGPPRTSRQQKMSRNRCSRRAQRVSPNYKPNGPGGDAPNAGNVAAWTAAVVAVGPYRKTLTTQ